MNQKVMDRPFLLVLGMHRSGTSFLVRALNLCGVYLGETESLVSHDWKNKPDNLRGHWENLRIVQLTDETLALTNGTWDNLPEKITINEKIGNEVKQIFKNMESSSMLLAGTKDPRLIICLSSWRQFLPKKIFIIGVFRHPVDVAKSLKIRNDFSLEKSLNLWKSYNEKLLEILEHHDGFLLDFDWPKNKLLDEIYLICKKFGLPHMDLSEWYTNNLIHHKSFQNKQDFSDDIVNLYSRLKERTKKNSLVKISSIVSQENMEIVKGMLAQIKNQGNYFKKIFDEIKDENSTIIISAKNKDDQIMKLNETASQKDGQIMKLNETVSQKDGQIMKLNETASQKDGQIMKLNETASQKDGQIMKLNETASQKDDQIMKLNEAVSDIENSTTWKMLRKYDSFKKLFKKE